MSNVNKALAILAALAFFLPFVSLSVNIPYIKVSTGITISGEKIVQCYLTPCSAKDIMGSQPGILGAAANLPGSTESAKIGSREAAALGINFVLFAAIAVVVAALTVFFGRGGELLSGVASIGAIVLLFMFRSKLGDFITPLLGSPEMKAAGIMGQLQFQFGFGFWGCAVLSGLSAILAFKGTTSGKAPIPAGAQRAIGGYAPMPQTGTTASSGEQLAVCSACGSVNAARSKFCLSCGAIMTATAPIAQAPQKTVAAWPSGPACPSCGSSNAGTGKFCLACGAAMAAPAAQPPKEETKAAAEPQEQGPVCPSCGSSNAGTGKFCLACGAAMAAPAAQPPKEETAPAAQPPREEKKVIAEPQGSVCSVCGASNPSTSKFCLSCGASLMAGVQLFQPSETHASTAPAGTPIAAAAAAAPVAMAAQASVTAPAGQPLRATASAPQPPAEPSFPAPAAQVISDAPPVQKATPSVPQAAPAPVPAKVADQSSLDWTASPPAQPMPAKHEHRVCAACGAAFTPGQQFCLACGKSVAAETASAETPGFAPSLQPEQFQPSAETQIFQPATKSSSKTWILVVVLLAAAGTGGWFAWKYFTRPDVTVIASVQRIHVAVGGKTSLEASVSGATDTDVDWSVQEGSKGGQVTASGTVMSSGQLHSGALYTAPETGGTYHVIATSHANPSRSARIEIIVGGAAAPDSSATTTEPAPPTAATATASTPPATGASPASAYPAAAQIAGTWSGPTSDMRTTIGSDSTISMTSAANPQKNLSGTYHFTDNSHLDVDFGNGDVRKWEILGVQGAYLRVSEQSKSGSSAIIFQKLQ